MSRRLWPARRQRVQQATAELVALPPSRPYRSERTVQAEVRRVAVEQTRPRLHVGRCRDEDTGGLLPGWRWSITSPDGRLLGTDVAPTQPAALALGTAVLELVTMAWDLGVGQVPMRAAGE